MTKEIWLNLSVKDVAKTQSFFENLGFSVNKHAPNSDTMVSMAFGSKNFIINFFREDVFKGLIGNQTATDSNKVLISIDAESSAEIDEILQKAAAAGGTVYAEGGLKHGWMYGGGFTDLDGHQWNLLWMDMSKMPR